MGERGVVVEVEPQPGRVHEDELALEPQLELLRDLEQVPRRRPQVVQRLLHLIVLERIQLEGPEGGVEHHQELPPRVAQEPVRRLDGLHHRGAPRAAVRGRHAPTSRSARLTAFRTRASLSCAAFSSTPRASALRIFPSAIAAQARVSGPRPTPPPPACWGVRPLLGAGGPPPPGPPGAFRPRASRTISSCAAPSSLARALSTSAALASASRSAALWTSSLTRSFVSFGTHPISVGSASGCSSWNSSDSSSSVGCTDASSSDCTSCDSASTCDRRAGRFSSVWWCSGVSSRARCRMTCVSRRMKATERKSPAPSR